MRRELMNAEERIRRNRIRRQRQLRRRLALFAAVVLLALSMAGGSFIVRAEDASSDIAYKYYTSIRIEKGDTLWSIAAEYGDEHFESGQDFLHEVIQINHLLDFDIRQGDYLIIPYYSSEFRR